MSIEERLKNVLGAIFNIEAQDIQEDFSAESIKEWDSLNQMNIIVAVEEEFNIQFGEADSILTNDFNSLKLVIEAKTLSSGTEESYVRFD